MDWTKITPFSPSMNGMLMSRRSPSSRFTLPVRPNSSPIATAPAKGGMISGSTPSVCTSTAPRNSKRVVK
jgi:hypothetical protein